MRSRSPAFAEAQLNAQRAPLVLLSIRSAWGIRLYASTGMADAEIGAPDSGAVLFDGSHTFDGAWTFGPTMAVQALQPRVLAYGNIREQLDLLPIPALAGGRRREMARLEVRLRNDDNYFGRLLSQETFVSAEISVLLGARGLKPDEFLPRFEGTVIECILGREALMLRSEAS